MFAHSLCFSLFALSITRQEGVQEAGREHNQTHDLNYWRRYYIPYVLLQSKKGGGVKKGSESSFAWELAGHQSAHGRWWLPLHCLFCFLSLTFSQLTGWEKIRGFSCFYCSFPLSLSTHSRGKWASNCVVLCCLERLRPYVDNILWQVVPGLNDGSLRLRQG